MFRVTITRDGHPDPVTVVATTRDVLQWEKTNRRHKSLGSLEKDLSIEDTYMISWYAARRKGLYTGTLAEFETECDIDFQEQDEEEAPADPTPPGPWPGP